jgi:SPASM domain peptide maturase of grasp-with-spasm system
MVFIHSSEKFEFTRKPEGQAASIVYVTDKINSAGHCGKISHKYFSINIKTFTEAQKHNTCLNRKISVDAEGNIKNCPSCNNTFGNMKDTSLSMAMNKNGFKDLWYISKDQIEVCKDCEFRYICTDCRAYIQNPDNIYSKPAKCEYDPYTATGF